jgi:hypothetical protein
VVDYIAAQAPWTISWSNVLNYINPAEFHRLARACSILGHTVHFGSSMNWVNSVRGACLFDFADAEARAQVLDQSTAWIRSMYDRMGMKPYLRCPPPENLINNAAVFLEPQCFHAWADY